MTLSARAQALGVSQGLSAELALFLTGHNVTSWAGYKNVGFENRLNTHFASVIQNPAKDKMTVIGEWIEDVKNAAFYVFGNSSAMQTGCCAMFGGKSSAKTNNRADFIRKMINFAIQLLANQGYTPPVEDFSNVSNLAERRALENYRDHCISKQSGNAKENTIKANIMQLVGTMSSLQFNTPLQQMTWIEAVQDKFNQINQPAPVLTVAAKA